MTVAADTRPLRHWLSAQNRPHLVVCCAEHPSPGLWSRVVVRPGSRHAVVRLATCLAGAGPAVLLELVAGGASGITVALDGCTHAADAAVVVAWADEYLSALRHPREADDPTIEGARSLAATPKRGRAWPILSSARVPMSRRSLLGRGDGLDLTEPSEHPTERLLAVLRELAGGQDPGTSLDAIPTGIPRLTAARCAGNGVCARTCPVGALALTSTVLAEAGADREAMAQFQHTFAPGRCTDCGQCLRVCPESALQRSGELLWSSLFARERVGLRVGLTRRCARCGSSHGRLGGLCAVCAYRAAHPFGSTLPPGWREPASGSRRPMSAVDG